MSNMKTLKRWNSQTWSRKRLRIYNIDSNCFRSGSSLSGAISSSPEKKYESATDFPFSSTSAGTVLRRLKEEEGTNNSNFLTTIDLGMTLYWLFGYHQGRKILIKWKKSDLSNAFRAVTICAFIESIEAPGSFLDARKSNESSPSNALHKRIKNTSNITWE